MMLAAVFGRDAVVRVLLEHGGSNVDAAENEGRTACHWACSRDYAGVLRQLLEAGSETSLRDGQGRTAAECAAHHCHRDCVRVLKECERAYLLQRTRRLRDASSAPSSSTPQQGS